MAVLNEESCRWASDADDGFFIDKPENPCYLPTAQCIVIKLVKGDRIGRTVTIERTVPNRVERSTPSFA